jgi:hydrogenase 3 maturation protease
MEERKTLPGTWKTSLQRLLQQLGIELGQTPRVAILGVGNTLRSDDAAGMLVAQELSKRECAADPDHLLILEAGHAPENRTGDLRKFAPDLVLFIDAANMEETPGSIQLIPEESIDGMSASTHSLPLSMLARYLTLELHCKVMFLGIQPLSNEFGETISAEVLQAVDEVVRVLEETIRPYSILQS